MAKHLQKEDLKLIANKILLYFKTKANIKKHWETNGRNQLVPFALSTFNISYTYYRRIMLTIFKFKDRTVAQQNAIQNKNRVKTCLERYGVENYTNAPDFRQKFQNTCLKNFGVLNPSQSNIIKERKKQTCLKHFGVECTFQSEYIRKKGKKTKKYLYGDENFTNRQKCKETKLQRYGDANYNNPNKSKQTCLKNFGVDSPSRCISIIKKKWKKYYVGNEYFDSFPELCLFLFYKKHNLKIKRLPVTLTYIFKKKKHYYYPDFKINNQLIELKNEYLIQKLFIKNTLDNAKYQCMQKHNVKLINESEYNKYIDWFYKQGYKKEDFLTKKN